MAKKPKSKMTIEQAADIVNFQKVHATVFKVQIVCMILTFLVICPFGLSGYTLSTSIVIGACLLYSFANLAHAWLKAWRSSPVFLNYDTGPMFVLTPYVRCIQNNCKMNNYQPFTQLQSTDCYCPKCNANRPHEGYHHCKVCKRCVYRYDHHCPWVQSCIGFGNKCYFVKYCIWCFICVALPLVNGLVQVCRKRYAYPWLPRIGQQVGLYIGLSLIPVLVLLFSASQMVKSLSLVGKDRTLIEHKIALQHGDKGKFKLQNYRIWLGKCWAIPLLVPFVNFQNMCQLYWRDIHPSKSAEWWRQNLVSPYYQQTVAQGQ